MDNYYQYFVDKGNHPNKTLLLGEEQELSFETFTHRDALQISHLLLEQADCYDRPIAFRITLNNTLVFQYLMQGLNNCSINWLERKERVTQACCTSSYFAFLDSIHDPDVYSNMIKDLSYAVCGGSIPIRVQNNITGSLTVTGLRPHEDHQLALEALKHYHQLNSLNIPEIK